MSATEVGGADGVVKTAAGGGLVWAYTGILLAVAFWGGSFIATKIALRSVSPLTVVAIRFGIGTLTLGTAALVRRQFVIPPRRDLVTFALLGAFGVTLHQGLQSTGLLTAQATTSAWIITTVPVFIAALGAIFLRESFGPAQIGGLLIAAVGAMTVVSRGDWSAVAVGRIGTTGDWLVLGSAVVWAVFSVLSKPTLKHHPALLAMLYVMGFGWLFALILFVGDRGWIELPRLNAPGWLGLTFLGVCCSGLAYVFWYGGLEKIPASRVGAFLYLEPIVTAVVAASLLREVVTTFTWIGGGMIVAGVWLVNQRSG
ncbi:MAG: DMT family transporter [Chloroflexi bacterium]|nr:DMT family transporter [Chloroflexota bacterium]MBI3763033.1 DMT family transporter [Chloroflexota bacterium]